MTDWIFEFQCILFIVLCAALILAFLKVRDQSDSIEDLLAAHREDLRTIDSLLEYIWNASKKAERADRDLEALQARARLCDRSAMRRKWDRLMGNPVAKMGAWQDMGPVVVKGKMSEIFYKLQEEVKETREARDRGNVVAFIDGIADIMYVCEAAGTWLGVDMNKAFSEVHRSNMTKNPYLFRQDGRGKGYDFEEPDFTEAMRKRV